MVEDNYEAMNAEIDEAMDDLEDPDQNMCSDADVVDDDEPDFSEVAVVANNGEEDGKTLSFQDAQSHVAELLTFFKKQKLDEAATLIHRAARNIEMAKLTRPKGSPSLHHFFAPK